MEQAIAREKMKKNQKWGEGVAKGLRKGSHVAQKVNLGNDEVPVFVAYLYASMM